MDSPEDTVFFKATPHNIAAFLAAHRWADMSAIGTVDEKTFLTARMGLIDICPDQEYLASKIIPAYAPYLMDPDKTMELETVPREVARSTPCPQPDWNYLRWDGYTDQKYQAIQSGDGLLKLPWNGKPSLWTARCGLTTTTETWPCFCKIGITENRNPGEI